MPEQVIEIEAFEPVIVSGNGCVTRYEGRTYRSDRVYVDASGVVWRYYGLVRGCAMWRHDADRDAWNIVAVVNQYGPLTEAGGDDDR